MRENNFHENGADRSSSANLAHFKKLARAKMPFGRYAGTPLIDLPEPYVVWFNRKGFPKGELGEMLKEVFEIKVNGLEHLFTPFRSEKE